MKKRRRRRTICRRINRGKSQKVICKEETNYFWACCTSARQHMTSAEHLME
jgi:hypothetical protein